MLLRTYLITVGVADGVGGWRSEGIESAFFSKALMECCRNVARRKKVDLSNPTKIMSRGYKDLMWLHSHLYGALWVRVHTVNGIKVQ